MLLFAFLLSLKGAALTFIVTNKFTLMLNPPKFMGRSSTYGPWHFVRKDIYLGLGRDIVKFILTAFACQGKRYTFKRQKKSCGISVNGLLSPNKA